MIPIYSEDDRIPVGVKVYRVTYRDGATYEYDSGYSHLIENMSSEVRDAQSNASWTTPAKPTRWIPWFDGAGLFMFFVLFILPILLCIVVYGIYPALLISGLVK